MTYPFFINIYLFILSGGDFYLCPLNAKQAPPEQLIKYLQPIWDRKQELTTIDYKYADGKTRDFAEGFELEIWQVFIMRDRSSILRSAIAFP
nr:hypothetical protein [Fischerella sp. JS2]